VEDLAMNFTSYVGKVFVVESNKAVIRDEQFRAQTYKNGDEIPPGKHVGDLKLIPQRTEVRVQGVKADSDRHTYVLAASNDTGQVFGWTSAANLEGQFKNETAGLAPSKWDLLPRGTNFTCVDTKAFIREGPPDFASKGTTIPIKTFVAVTETAPDGTHVKVSKIKIVQDEMQIEEEIGWTLASNLREGCCDFYFSDEWTNQKGPNACWRRGDYIGPKLLVNIVGAGAEMEQVTLDSLDAYIKLKDAAEEENIQLAIHSAFRTFQRQVELFQAFKHGTGNLAAEPGRSNHQHGQAFDLNTLKNKFNGSDKIYEWLKKNGPKHGFVRTVKNESWHWEYRPVEAKELAAVGRFKLPEFEDTV
jgi:hypothetical protein